MYLLRLLIIDQTFPHPDSIFKRK